MAAMAVSIVSSRARGSLMIGRPSRRSTYLAITSTSRLTGSPGARAPSVVSRRVVGMRLTSNQGSGLVGRADGADGQRDAVDGDRALLDDVAGELGRQRDAHDLPVLAGRAGEDAADAVDVALHEVAAEAGVRGDRALEVDAASPSAAAAQAAAPEGLGHDVGAPDAALGVGLHVGDGEADAVDRDRVAEGDALQHPVGADPEHRRSRSWSSRTTRVPTSSTMPVNTSTPSVRVLPPTSVPGRAQP